jgi:hypothetical protein
MTQPSLGLWVGLFVALGFALALAAGLAIGIFVGRPAESPSERTLFPPATRSDIGGSGPAMPFTIDPVLKGGDPAPVAPVTPAPATPAPATPAPVTPPSRPVKEEILVSGEPPLTRETVTQFIDFFEWVLDIRMNQELRKDFQDHMVNAWTKADRAEREKMLQACQAMRKARKEMGEAELAQRRAAMVAGLRKSTDPLDRKLLALYEARHGKTERGPADSDDGALTMTIERANAQPEKFTDKLIVFKNVRMSGTLSKHKQASAYRENPTRFLFEVVSTNGKRFTISGYGSGELMFAVSPDMADKLATDGLVANRHYVVNLTGRIAKMGFGFTSGWTFFVTRIDFVDGDGKISKTVRSEPPSAR